MAIVRFMLKLPGYKPRLQECESENYDDHFRKIVARREVQQDHTGVTLEWIRFSDRLSMVVNEDGRRLKMDSNFITPSGGVVLGPVCIGRIGSNGLLQMTDEDIADVCRFFESHVGLKSQYRPNERCFFCGVLLDATEHVCAAQARK